MKKKVIDLEILENFLDSGVSKISLVDSPAIEVDWFAFKEEEFVYPSAGEDKDTFLGRCIAVNIDEGRPEDQAAAICYRVWDEHKMSIDPSALTPYVDQITKDKKKKEKMEGAEMDVLGYQTRYFYMCPGALGTFTHILEMELDEETKGMVRSAAVIADRIFQIEAEVIEKASATEQELREAVLLIDDFKDIFREIDEEVGMEHDVSYMDGHAEVIYEYYKQEFDLDEACWPGYEAIGTKIKDGKRVPNCVPVESSVHEFQSYTDYPEGASNNAKRAIEYKEANNIDCGTQIGWTRARQLAERKPISRETVGRMAAFERHRQNSDTPYSEGCGGIMWDAWGGDSGIRWAQTKMKEFEGKKLLFADEDQKILVGPAMIPDMEIVRKDENGDPYYVRFTKEVVAKIAEKFMRELRNDQTNIEHEEVEAGSYVMETWLVEDPEHDKINTKYGFDLPEGTWAVKMRVTDDKTWKMVKSGELNGFSIEGNFMSREDYKDFMEDKKTYERIAKILKSL